MNLALPRRMRSFAPILSSRLTTRSLFPQIDLADVRTAQGKLYLIESSSRIESDLEGPPSSELHEKVTRVAGRGPSWRFLRRLIEAVPLPGPQPSSPTTEPTSSQNKGKGRNVKKHECSQKKVQKAYVPVRNTQTVRKNDPGGHGNQLTKEREPSWRKEMRIKKKK